MPYVPPHLRPGYIPVKVEKPDFTGKIHWPTNLDSHKDTNVIQPNKIHSPHLGIVAAKSALKLTEPIQLNSQPLKRPDMKLGHNKFNRAVRKHILKSKSKRVSRRRSISHKKVKKVKRTRKTY